MFPADRSAVTPWGAPGSGWSEPVAGEQVPAPRRHALDPDPVLASKAVAVQWLGIVSLVFSPVLAGALPAVLALVLARDTAGQMRASRGFLTGVRPLQWGVRLAQWALWVAAAVAVFAIVLGLLRTVGPGSANVHYGPGVN